jgi:hypothetical protein
MTSLYVDPKRKAGSQSEVPVMQRDGEWLCFDGYQRFCLGANSIRLGKHDHRRKFGMIRPYLLGSVDKARSLIDLGCSAGVMGFQAYLEGYQQITFVDHDEQYLELVDAGIKHLGAAKARTKKTKVQGLSEQADVLFVFAIIHWLYSCTEDFGSLDRIIEKLSQHASRTMFIEWVGPDCKDVQSFGHIDFNESVHANEYTRENFVTALEARYANVRMIGRVRQGREIWIASNDAIRASAVSRVLEKASFFSWRVRQRLSRNVASGRT